MIRVNYLILKLCFEKITMNEQILPRECSSVMYLKLARSISSFCSGTTQIDEYLYKGDYISIHPLYDL
jgi:hypothetical protein